MKALAHDTPEETERRKAAAASVLRWMNDEITQAPERYIRDLNDNLSFSIGRTALLRTISNGTTISASVLFSIDGNRLDNLYMAAAQDSSTPEGRKNASEYTVKASKFLTLEHQLIDADLVQYTVNSESSRIGVSNHHTRLTAASQIIEMMNEMRDSPRNSEKDVIKEPMMKAFYKALQAVATHVKLSPYIALALENNANQKAFLGQAPDPNGVSADWFQEQSSAYRNFARLSKANGLIAGIDPEISRGRG